MGLFDRLRGRGEGAGGRPRARGRWFRVRGVPFFVLREDERDTVLAQFEALLAQAQSGFVLARRVMGSLSWRGYVYPVVDMEFYAYSRHGNPVSAFYAVECEPPRRPRALGVRGGAVVLETGELARVYVAYRFPSVVYEGLPYLVLAKALEVALYFNLIPKHRAVGMADAIRRRRAGVTGVLEEASVEAVTELASRVLGGSDLYEFQLAFTVTAGDPGKLEEAGRELVYELKAYGVEAEAPPGQLDLYNLSPPRGLVVRLEPRYADSMSLRALFPFVDEELRDEGGVLVGFSGSGSPVVLNPWAKPNPIFTIVGVSGSGKSMTAKVFMSRLHEVDDDTPIVGVDPESEYTSHGRRFGSDVIEVSEGSKLGLDPVKLVKAGLMEMGQAVDILSEIYAVPQELQGVLRGEFFALYEKVGDLAGLVEHMRHETLKLYLEGALAPPDKYVYEGRLPPLDQPTIFGLREVRSRRLKILISALISTYSYNKLLTKASKSVFFVDEAWLFADTPAILSLFENLARRGRKYGVCFIYITQRPEDLARSQQGRTILEQASTALLMRVEPEGRDVLKDIYKLSDSEADILVSAPVGRGILKSGVKRLMISVEPTPEELRLFSTSPAGGR